MICGASPLSSSNDEFFVFEDDKAMVSGNLSVTSQKLYIWEKKLYDEVRVCFSTSNWEFPVVKHFVHFVAFNSGRGTF